MIQKEDDHGMVNSDIVPALPDAISVNNWESPQLKRRRGPECDGHDSHKTWSLPRLYSEQIWPGAVKTSTAPALQDAVLADYNRRVPDTRNADALAVMTRIITKLGNTVVILSEKMQMHIRSHRQSSLMITDHILTLKSRCLPPLRHRAALSLAVVRSMWEKQTSGGLQ